MPNSPDAASIPLETSSVYAHNRYFVTTTGSSSSSGDSANPWSLTTALSGGNPANTVQPGDTIFIMPGTYSPTARVTVSIKGDTAAFVDVVVRGYPNAARPVINGASIADDNFVVTGHGVVIMGLEFTNTSTARTASTDSDHSYRRNVVVNNGHYNTYRNNVIHDGGVAFYSYETRRGLVMVGNIIYNNGWRGPGWGHGHGVYLRTTDPDAFIYMKGNIIFNQFGYGVHLYPPANSPAWFEFSENVAFNNGTVDTNSASQRRAYTNLGNVSSYMAMHISAGSNSTFFPSSGIASVTNMKLGSGFQLQGGNNWSVGGATQIQIGTWTDNSMSSNTTYASLPGTMNPVVRTTYHWFGEGRGHIVVYNGRGDASVSASLSGIISSGENFEIRNVQRLNDAPVVSGMYNGSSVTLPLTGVTPYAPIGWAQTGPVTGPYFQVFLVTRVP